MSDCIPEQAKEVLLGWLIGHPSITKAWFFGSRAKRMASNLSDLDVAVELNPEDGESLAEWLEHAQNWRNELSKLIPYPRVDLQLAQVSGDLVVRLAVEEHGILFYERACLDRDGPEES